AGIEAAVNHVALEQALAALSHDAQHVLRLYFVEELPQRVIADRFGVSQMQVSRWISRAVSVLRAHMGVVGPEETGARGAAWAGRPSRSAVLQLRSSASETLEHVQSALDLAVDEEPGHLSFVVVGDVPRRLVAVAVLDAPIDGRGAPL